MSNVVETNELNVLQEVATIEKIKKEIKVAQQKARLNLNKEMIVYWNVGKVLDEYGKWGNKFIEKLSFELKKDFPTLKGFSTRNLKNMLKFYREYSDFEFVQSVAAQITWTHK